MFALTYNTPDLMLIILGSYSFNLKRALMILLKCWGRAEGGKKLFNPSCGCLEEEEEMEEEEDDEGSPAVMFSGSKMKRVEP